MTAVTIAGQVAAMAGASAGQPPGEVMGVFARQQAELAARGIPEGIIAAGALLPGQDHVVRWVDDDQDCTTRPGALQILGAPGGASR
jgi:hypothetical protein